MTSRAALLVLFAGLLVGGFGGACAPTRESAVRDLQSRASIELSCPVNRLTFTPMSSETVVYDGETTDTPKSMGVQGCGHTATYVWVKDKGYVMNNQTTTTVTSN